MKKRISTPITKEALKDLKIGDTVLISGTIYTARDAAHERMVHEYEKTGKLPFDIKNQIIYYAGPCPAKPGHIIGSCGPTTAGRMDAYTPLLLDLGLCAMIGKGARNDNVKKSMQKNCAIYFGASGGAGALIAGCIKSSEIIAYPDLGTEAIRRLEVSDLPVVVLFDCEGSDLYKEGQAKYICG